jgi:cysteinyl-tRNA synthetase
MAEGKKNPHDFALWRFAKPNDLQYWDSPWGKGNPGWSIECSAMATSLLGPSIDIHTGGEDLATIHHNNEIAQSEGASGNHPFVRTWVHCAFLTMGDAKASRSLGNSFTLDDVIAKGIDPLALRYLYLQAHYRKPLSFTWEALTAANEALGRLRRAALETKKESGGATKTSPAEATLRRLVADDLATPAALALLWDSLKSGMTAPQKYSLLKRADALFGLSLFRYEVSPHLTEGVPAEIQDMVKKREEARKNKDFAAADQLRIHIRNGGYHVDDGALGPIVTKLSR